MEKIKIEIDRCDGLEVYCLRNAFGYCCDNTPKNCTECPLMHFLYHDLTNNTLADESAAELKELVETSRAFSGEYDGCDNLPQEVWAAIYAIRKAFYNWDHATDKSALFYNPESETYKRFIEWFGQNGTVNGMPVGRFVVRTALQEIYTGKWMVMDPSNKHNEYPDIQDYSGTYVPVTFDDAADGIRYATDALLKMAKKTHPAFIEENCHVAITHSFETEFPYIRLFLTLNEERAAKRLVWVPNDEDKWTYNEKSFTGLRLSNEDDFYDFVRKMHQVSVVLLKVHESTASTYRARYMEKVKEKQPGIQFIADDRDWPEDPNHPIHKEADYFRRFCDEDEDDYEA